MALKPLVPADLTSMMEAGYSPAQQRAAGLNVGSPYGDQTFIQPVMIPVPQKSGVASLQDMYEQKRDVYRSILGDPEEQRSAAQSQALFTIANFGLQLAGATGGRVGASFGEKLAQAAQGSQLFPSISAISQQQREAQQKFDLAALQAAETERAAALKAQEERRTAAAKPQKPDYQTLVSSEGLSLGVFNVSTPRGRADFEKAQAANPGSFPGSPEIVSEADFFNKYGLTRSQFAILPEEDKRRLMGLTDSIKGIPRDVYDRLSSIEQQVVLGLTPGEQVRSVGDTLIKTNLDGTTTTLFSLPPKPTYKIMENELVEIIPGKDGAEPTTRVVYEQEIAEGLDPDYRIIFDTSTNTEKYVDVSTTAGRAAVDSANEANVKAGGTLFELRTVPTQQQKAAKAYLLEDQNKIVLSYDGGRTYVDEGGQTQSIPTTGSTPLSDTIAYAVAKNARVRAVAGKQLEAIAQEFMNLGINDLRVGDRGDPVNLSGEQKSIVKDAVRAALDGTGPWARLGGIVNSALGGIVGIEVFPNTPDNQNYLKAIRILGRSALVVNPRFPVAEMQTVGALFPNEEAFFTSPEAEARKLVSLKRVAIEQLTNNLSKIESGTLAEKDLEATMTNNNELRRLLSLLGSVPADPSATGSGAAMEAWRSFMKPKGD